MASGVIALQNGLEPIMQMTCRDRNRLAMQADILGASALGIRNVLCLTGDHQSFGNHPEAKGVYDLDSIKLIQMYKDMRDEKKFQCGEEMTVAPQLFIGCAENPFADPFEFRALRLKKKVEAGADFIQTQCIYNVPKFKKWMEEVRATRPAQGDQDPRRHHADQGRGRRAVHAEVRPRHGRAAGDRRPHGRRREGTRRRTPRARRSPSR